jgi:hypothetical protein
VSEIGYYMAMERNSQIQALISSSGLAGLATLAGLAGLAGLAAITLFKYAL